MDARKLVNKYADHESAKKSSDLVNGDEFNRINGILAGREVGHEEIGEKYGREGVVGALAAKDGKTSIKDVYTRKNIVNRAKNNFIKNVGKGTLGGAAIGAGVTAAGSQRGDSLAYLTNVGLGAALGAGAGVLKTASDALIKPGINYWRGKKAAELENMKRKYNV